jgi:hypothetical protein
MPATRATPPEVSATCRAGARSGRRAREGESGDPDHGDAGGRGERREQLPALRDAQEELAEDLVLRRVVLVQPVVVVALDHEAVAVHGDDPVHDDGVEGDALVCHDVADGVGAGGTQDRQVPGVEARLHADAVRADVRRRAAERERPEHPHSGQHQRGCGADADGSGGGLHGKAPLQRLGRGGRCAAPPDLRRG